MPYYFAYGSNSLAQLSKRLGTDRLRAYPAILPDYIRIFAGYGRRWGGAVASILPQRGSEVLGSVICLRESQFKRLDQWEHTDPHDPGSNRGYYRRERVRIHTFRAESPDMKHCSAYTYILNTPFTTHAPTDAYLGTCYRTVRQFWPIPYLEVRDHTLTLTRRWRPRKMKRRKHVTWSDI